MSLFLTTVRLDGSLIKPSREIRKWKVCHFRGTFWGQNSNEKETESGKDFSVHVLEYIQSILFRNKAKQHNFINSWYRSWINLLMHFECFFLIYSFTSTQVTNIAWLYVSRGICYWMKNALRLRMMSLKVIATINVSFCLVLCRLSGSVSLGLQSEEGDSRASQEI